MKKFLFICVLLLISIPIFAQRTGNGPPSNPCSPPQYYKDLLSANAYWCNGNNLQWQLEGGSGGGGNLPSMGGVGTVDNFMLPGSAPTGFQYNVQDALPNGSTCTYDGGTNTGAIATFNGSNWICNAVAATLAFDTAATSLFSVYLAGRNVTSSSFANPTLGKLITLVIKQDSTGGRTFAWPANAINHPTISSTARVSTTASFYYDGTNWQYIVLPQSSANLVSAASLGNGLFVANAFPSTFGDQGSQIVNADMACGTLPCTIVYFGTGAEKITQEVVVRSGHNLILSGGTWATLSPDSGVAITGRGDIPNPWTQLVTFGTEQPIGVPIILQDNTSLTCTGWDTIIQEPTVTGQWTIVTPFANAVGTNNGQSNNIHISGCHFQGANPAGNSGPQNIALGNLHNGWVDHNFFDSMHTIALQAGGASTHGTFAQSVWLTDNLFDHCVSQNIANVNGNDVHVNRNIIRHAGIASTQIDFETNVGSDQLSSCEIGDNIIDNADVTPGTINNAIAVQCGGSNCFNVNIHGNTIRGLLPLGSGEGGILVFSVNDVMVSGNALLNTNDGIALNQCSGGGVIGNRMENAPGISLTASQGVTVSNNISHDASGISEGNGLFEDADSDSNVFSNNTGFEGSVRIFGPHSYAINNTDLSCFGFPTCSNTTVRNVTRSTTILQTNSGFAITPKVVSANYALTSFDGTILANSAGGAFTITLPALNFEEQGRQYSIKLTAGTNLVTIVGDSSTGAQTIDGASSYTGLSTAGTCVTLSYGTGGSGAWSVIGTCASQNVTATAGKTVHFNNSINFSGTDGTTMTLPTTSATLARTDASNSFAGNQTIINKVVSLNGDALAANGLPGIVALSQLTGLQTAQTNSVYTPTQDGFFEVFEYGVVTTAATSGTVTQSVTWTDADTNISETTVTNTFNAGVLGSSNRENAGMIHVKAGAPIQVVTTFTTVVGTVTYALYTSVKRIL